MKKYLPRNGWPLSARFRFQCRTYAYFFAKRRCGHHFRAMSELRTHVLPRGQVTDVGKDLIVATGAVRDRARAETLLRQ